jgi:hypothetical protein
MVPTLSQMNLVDTSPSYLFLRPILSSYLCLGLRSDFFSSGFPTKILYAYLFSPMCTTFSAHHTLYDFIIPIIFGEEWKLWRCSLRNFLQPPIISSFFDANILLSILFSNTLSLWSYLNSETKFHSHTRVNMSQALQYLIIGRNLSFPFLRGNFICRYDC